MSSSPVISVKNLSKCYPIYNRPSDRLKQFIFPKLNGALGRPPKLYYREFWPLRNVSFEVAKGETVGIVGRNGSGKSTLLQLICGTLNPTQGTIKCEGRIAALLELGSGFNPEFTGRENVYMNAAILGLSNQEIDARYQDIIDFADIGEFIHQPVKTYSSGMLVRLAFAVQAQVSPQILIVDEALAVGDVKFQAKCFDRLRRLKEQGTSILLVSHSAEQIVTLCSKAILLEGGTIYQEGNPKDVVNTYLDLLFGKQRLSDAELHEDAPITDVPGSRDISGPVLSNAEDLFSTRYGYNPHEYRWGDGAARIIDYFLAADNSPAPSSITSGQTVSLWVRVRFARQIFRPIFGFTLKTKEGMTVYGVNSETLDIAEFKDLGAQAECITIRVDFECRLAAGDYFLSLGIASRDNDTVVPHDRRYDSIHLQVTPTPSFFGLADLKLNLKIEKTVASEDDKNHGSLRQPTAKKTDSQASLNGAEI